MVKKYYNIFIGTIILVLLFLFFGLLKSILTSYDIPYAVNLLTFLLPIIVYYVLKLLQKRFNHFNISIHLTDNGKFLLPVLVGLSIGSILFCIIIFISIASESIQDVKFIIINKKAAEIFFSQIIISTCEEFFFRGFLFLSILIQTKKILFSALISSIFFSLIHFQSYSLIDGWYIYLGIFSGGMVFCYLYLIFRSLWITISLHFINNFIASIVSWKQVALGIDPTDKIQTILMLILFITLTVFVITREENKKYFLKDFLQLS